MLLLSLLLYTLCQMRQYKQVSDDLTDLRHSEELIEQYQTLIFLALLTSHLRQRVYTLLKTSPEQLFLL